VPALPWVVSIAAADGNILGSWAVNGSTSYHLFVRRFGPMLEPGPTFNLGPGPMLPCPSLYFDTPQPE
jgi:hypothetical protein